MIPSIDFSHELRRAQVLQEHVQLRQVIAERRHGLDLRGRVVDGGRGGGGALSRVRGIARLLVRRGGGELVAIECAWLIHWLLLLQANTKTVTRNVIGRGIHNKKPIREEELF